MAAIQRLLFPSVGFIREGVDTRSGRRARYYCSYRIDFTQPKMYLAPPAPISLLTHETTSCLPRFLIKAVDAEQTPESSWPITMAVASRTLTPYTYTYRRAITDAYLDSDHLARHQDLIDLLRNYQLPAPNNAPAAVDSGAGDGEDPQAHPSTPQGQQADAARPALHPTTRRVLVAAGAFCNARPLLPRKLELLPVKTQTVHFVLPEKDASRGFGACLPSSSRLESFGRTFSLRCGTPTGPFG